ncbi:recombinase RecT [Laribacter hongkongensis]|uniref:recombinase RecT n=1 Tax=Laribacter hongkongensis TaxID=168471 RepID=UPI001EFECAC3|nr:recombinase RecT [Laribacter hongkongensis]MCG9054748.1 recombinase RecT [Laribacter hongkongensis]
MPQVSVGLTNLQGFELAQRAAKLLASSTLVPKEYQGNLPNCVIALNMAQRVGADPLMVMQNLVIVHGRPTWSAQFLIATVNTCGRFSALRFEFFGERNTDEWGCRAWAIEKATGEKLVGSDVTIGIARKEGWYGKNGSKWQSIPQQMLMYRAGGWWTRAFAPELSMGLQTADEAGDIYDATPDASGTYSVSMDDLRSTEASIEQQAAQEAPAAAAPMDVDPQTGEVIGNDEADHSPDELGLQDALAAIKDGDLTVAQDIARGLSETDRAIVDQAIENKRTTRRRPAAGLDLE